MLLDKGCQLRVGLTDVTTSWDAAPLGGNDAMLRWLEHYADALHQRLACARIRQDLLPSGICLYPVKPPWQVPACLPSYHGRLSDHGAHNISVVCFKTQHISKLQLLLDHCD